MLTKEEKAKIKAEEEYRQEVKNTVVKTTYGLPALLSFLIPGLGQLVKGEVLKGILSFIAVPLGLMFWIIPGVIIWIWQIADAYSAQVK